MKEKKAITNIGYATSAIFILEMVLKIWGLSVGGYFGSGQNCFDALIVLLTLVELFLSSAKLKVCRRKSTCRTNGQAVWSGLVIGYAISRQVSIYAWSTYVPTSDASTIQPRLGGALPKMINSRCPSRSTSESIGWPEIPFLSAL